MTKVTLLGAGSGFTQPLFTDILLIDGLDAGVIGLVDIDAKRLDVNVKLMHRILELMGKSKQWRIEASTNRKNVLRGTDYLISTIEVHGVPCVRHDNDIPLRYGIDQCIGDTIGPGGLMKLLRTAPDFIAILQDAKRLCPNALIMNYTNPMSMITLTGTRVTDQPLVGLCHSVQWDSKQIAKLIGIPYGEMVWRCGGINHLAWFTELTWKGRDLYPTLRHVMTNDAEWYDRDTARVDMMLEFGYYPTESSCHFSEYVPWFRKRKDLRKKYAMREGKPTTSLYADNWPKWRKETDKHRREMAAGKREIKLGRSHEYAADIIEAHAFDRQRKIQASVRNTGIIPNLPLTGVVEVAVLVDKQGYTPTYFGSLPEQCAALCRASMAVYELGVQSVLTKDREAMIHAMQLDPLSAAVCSLSEIRQMAEELFKAERPYIPKWCAKPKVVAKPKLITPPKKKRGDKAVPGASDVGLHAQEKKRRKTG
jgi:alpha-galactosidase